MKAASCVSRIWVSVRPLKDRITDSAGNGVFAIGLLEGVLVIDAARHDGDQLGAEAVAPVHAAQATEGQRGRRNQLVGRGLAAGQAPRPSGSGCSSRRCGRFRRCAASALGASR